MTRPNIHAHEFRDRISRLLETDAPRYRRLWSYYRNPLAPLRIDSQASGSERPYRSYQEWGLPSRITGVLPGGTDDLLSSQSVDGVARKEVVVENDIAWRVDTLVDFLFGKPIVINSTSSDTARRSAIELLIRAILAHNGGIVFLQHLAVLGAVYGFVDVMVKFEHATDQSASDDETTAAGDTAPSAAASDSSVPPPAGPASGQPDPLADGDGTTRDGRVPSDAQRELLTRVARCIRLEIVEPARALPLLDPVDWRVVDAYAQVYCVARKHDESKDRSNRLVKRSWLDRFLSRFAAGRSPAYRHPAPDDDTLVIDLITPIEWNRYENERLVAHGANALGRIPLVHIQNTAVPFEYAGAGDVEPLLPLQDELNTRLSDRAHRIALQSFKMYLGKGIENFGQLPVAPGRMWMTDNEQAEVLEFGGDSGSPSEGAHINEIREAMDKTSNVTPIAAGAIKGRIGRLTSAAALRVTLLALLAKTERKRTTYGEGIEKMCELALAWLDAVGLFHTHPDERRIEIHWPNPIPANDAERLDEAEAKLRLGIDRATVLRELGY